MRLAFMDKVKDIDLKDLVFIDESGIEDNACLMYGWSKRGDRCYGEKIYQHRTRISMIAGLCQKQMLAPMMFEGTCNTNIFTAYVENILVKELIAGQIVVMDNISFHKTQKVREMIEAVGCSILFLPTYSPDLNPIEHWWFKIKNEIRKVASNFIIFSDAVYHVLRNVTTLSI